MKKLRQLQEGGSVARLTGVGGRESRRQAYMDVFTAPCQASHRTAAKPTTCRSHFVHVPYLSLPNNRPVSASIR